MLLFNFFFFFSSRRRHTRWNCDWSSDVCSSDLHFYVAPYLPSDRVDDGGGVAHEGEEIEVLEVPFAEALAMVDDGRIADGKTIMLLQWAALHQIGRASCRERV